MKTRACANLCSYSFFGCFRHWQLFWVVVTGTASTSNRFTVQPLQWTRGQPVVYGTDSTRNIMDWIFGKYWSPRRSNFFRGANGSLRTPVHSDEHLHSFCDWMVTHQFCCSYKYFKVNTLLRDLITTKLLTGMVYAGRILCGFAGGMCFTVVPAYNSMVFTFFPYSVRKCFNQ